MTFKEFKEQWGNYLGNWYNCRKPANATVPVLPSGVKPDAECFFNTSNAKDIKANIDYMPEPYYTGTDFLLATDWAQLEGSIVVLDLNPGLSHPNDCLKNVNWHNPEIVNNLANGSYSDINAEYSPFISTNYAVPGVQWWDGNRLSWISRFFDISQDLVKNKMFALEMCPFHSKKWDCKILQNPDVIKYIKDSVINPAAMALHKSFGICFGKDWEIIFDALGFREVGFWGVEYDRGLRNLAARQLKGVALQWPQDQAWPSSLNKLICRKYVLYEGSAINLETGCEMKAYFLCLRAEGTFKSPGPKFADVEKTILEDIKNIIQG